MQYLGHSWLYPTGTIMSYIGTEDPDGWVICNGTLRTATDSRYRALATMLAGTNTANSLTPPDLRGKFLYSSSNNTTLTTGGSSTVTLTTENIPSHSHIITVTDPGHTHSNTATQDSHNHGISISDPGHAHGNYLNDPTHFHLCLMKFKDDGNFTCGDYQNPPGDSGNSSGRYWGTNYSYSNLGLVNVAASTGISASADYRQPNVNITNATTTTGITATSSSVGSGTAFSILPPYTTVNYI